MCLIGRNLLMSVTTVSTGTLTIAVLVFPVVYIRAKGVCQTWSLSWHVMLDGGWCSSESDVLHFICCVLGRG